MDATPEEVQLRDGRLPSRGGGAGNVGGGRAGGVGGVSSPACSRAVLSGGGGGISIIGMIGPPLRALVGIPSLSPQVLVPPNHAHRILLDQDVEEKLDEANLPKEGDYGPPNHGDDPVLLPELDEALGLEEVGVGPPVSCPPPYDGPHEEDLEEEDAVDLA